MVVKRFFNSLGKELSLVPDCRQPWPAGGRWRILPRALEKCKIFLDKIYFCMKGLKYAKGYTKVMENWQHGWRRRFSCLAS